MPDFNATFDPVVLDVEQRATVADAFIDRDLYQVYMATLWANVVLNPDDVGLLEEDLEDLHDYLNERIKPTLGAKSSITEVFRFINSKNGEQAMQRAKVNSTHQQMLLYFASMILDPERHQMWMDRVRDEQESRKR